MNIIIIDDEKNCRGVIQKLIGIYFKDIHIIGQAANIDEAYTLIKKHAPDLIFLDIEMPNGDGFELLDKFENIDFQVIFTTAHDNHAANAIKYHVVDYLLKPIDGDELKEAVEKAKKILLKPVDTKQSEDNNQKKLEMNGQIGLPVKEGIVFVPVSDIIRIESDGGYSTFYTADKERYIVAKNLIEYENILPPAHFFRVHKSHIINIKKVKKYIRIDGYFVEMEGGTMVEISRRKKDEFLEMMNLTS